MAVNTLSLCEKCLLRDRVKLEEQLFEVAEKISYIDYDGPFLFWNGVVPAGEFFRTRIELEQYCFTASLLPPTWVWACEGIGFLLDAEALLTNTQDRTGHDIRSRLEDHEVEDLQTLLDAWAMKQKFTTYDVDYSRAIILDEVLDRKLKARAATKFETPAESDTEENDDPETEG